MGTTLEGKQINQTYQGLLKTTDNAEVSGTAKEITDGKGNGTGVSLSNDGQVTATGTVSFGSLKDSTEDITVTKFVDEADGIGNNDNDTTIPTSAAVKDYVDTNVTSQDLDFQGDSGSGAVDLDSQSLDIAGGTGIDTGAVDQTLTVSIDSTVATLSDTQTLTNKTVDADNNTVSNLEVDNLKSGVLDTDLTSVSASDDTLASAKAIKTYVDSNVTAQDLDITDGTTTSSVDLDSQTLTVEGTANEVEVSLTDQTFTVGLPSSITTDVTGDLIGDVTGNADTASALETARTISLSGDVAGSVSFDGSANADITATIQANSVALGTDTTGDYVENLGTGTGVTIGSNSGEGSSPTISVDYGSSANTAVQGDTTITITGTANEVEVTGTSSQALGGAPSYQIGLPNDVSLGGSLTIAQNLTVNGTTTTVNTDTLSVEDPLIELARDNSENSVDVGLYGKYSLDSGTTTKYSGLFKDASDSDKFKLFKGLEVEPTATIDTSGTGYTKGDLVINDLDAVDGTFSGDIALYEALQFFDDSSTPSASAFIHRPTSNTLALGTNSSEAMRIDSSGNATFSGNIGIGTSNPELALHIVKSGENNGIRIITDNTYNSLIHFGDSNDNNIGRIVYNHTDNAMKFFTNDAERVIINSSGNVGIGTSIPERDLHIHRDTNTDVHLTNSASGTTATDGGTLTLSGLDFLINNRESGNLRLFTSATERLRIDSSGNVGIGTDSPTRELEVTGSGNVYIKVTAPTDNDSSAIELQNTQENWTIRNNDTNNDAFEIDSSTTGNIVTIQKTGTVGIGTDSPARKVHIKDSSVAAIQLENTSEADSFVDFMNPSRTFRVGYDDSADAFKVAVTNFNDNSLVVNSSGNVGIGTSSPSAALDVKDVPSGGSGTILNVGLDASNPVRAKIHTETYNGAFSLYDSGSSEDVKITTSGNSWFNGGNVGIGTDSPTAGLSVDAYGSKFSDEQQYYQPSGSIFVSSRAVQNTDNWIGITGNYGDSFGSANLLLQANFRDFGSQAGHYISSKSSGLGTADLVFGQLTAGASNTTAPTLTERMRIDSSGRVGIGRTPTSNLLEVADTIKLTNLGTSEGFIGFNTNGQKIGITTVDAVGAGMKFEVGATERMRIDSSGNVGIGANPVDDKLHILGDSVKIQQQGQAGISFKFNHGNNTSINSDVNYANIKSLVTSGVTGAESGVLTFETRNSGTTAERMRITSGGDVSIGTDTPIGGTMLTLQKAFGGNTAISTNTTTASTTYVPAKFLHNGTLVGYIASSTTSTAYNTTSDYRLKENVVPMEGALDRVDALKPSRFNFIADEDTTVDGFLAHEVQDIVPEAVTGDKDAMRTEEYEVSPAVYKDVIYPAEAAVYETIEHPAIEEELDEEGNVIVEGKDAYTEEILVTEAKEEWTENVLVSEKVMGTREVPDYQGIDQSKLVPLLVGAIKELNAKVAALEAQINN